MLKKKEYGRVGECAWYGTLDNGLRIVVIPKPDFKKTSAYLAVNYGGVNLKFFSGGEWHETPAGVAHYLEHKMFENEDGSDALKALTARGAYADAVTSAEMTGYSFECVDSFYENLETLLNFVFSPHFTEEGVEKERGIIGQEIRMTEDNPDYVMYYGLMKALYSHNPVKDDCVAGTVETISDITAETLHECYNAFYTPANMVLAVVGDQDPQKIWEIADRLLPRERKELPRRDRGSTEGEFPVESRVENTMQVGAKMFLAGIKTVEGLSGKEALRFELMADLALCILMGNASPLYNKMYADGLVNESFSFALEMIGGVSFITFGSETEDPDGVMLRVLDEAQNLAAVGIKPEVFRRRKNSALGGELRGLNSVDSLCYNAAEAALKGYDYFETMDILNSITPEDVTAFYRKYFVPERLAVSIMNKLEDNTDA